MFEQRVKEQVDKWDTQARNKIQNKVLLIVKMKTVSHCIGIKNKIRYYGLLNNWHKINIYPLVLWGSLCCELPFNHYITINSMNIIPQTYIRVVNMLVVVELWWFNVVGPRFRAICNIATPENERMYNKIR